MRKRADALEEYVNLLESVLEKCRREHGGISDNGQSYLQFRPRDADGMILPDEFDVDNDEPGNEDQVFSQELCLPTRNLKLDEGNLLLHGNTAVFRFAPEPSTPQVLSRFPLNSQAPRYVLLVEGIEEQNYNLDFDWSRYLPTSVPLDRKEHDKLLDLLLKFFMSWCLRLVPDLFLRDMHQTLATPRSQTPPKTAHYSPMLHNSLMAVATAFSDDPRIRDLKSRQAFAAVAKSYIEAECQQPNISVIHALSLLGSYHSGLGEQTLGYFYFVGLSIDCSAWVKSGLISEHDMLDRNWAHWTIFTQDVCWSLYVGRDFSIPSTSDAKRIPIPFVDAQFDAVSWYYPPSGIPPQPNFLSTTFAASCELLLIARRIMDVVNGLNTASVRHEVNDELINHVKLCKRAAENIVELLGTWRSLYTLRYAPITLVQTAFSAGTIYLLGAVQAASGLRVAQESLKHCLAQAQLCVQYLLEIGKSWQCATNIGEILRRLLQEQLKPLLDRRAIREVTGQGQNMSSMPTSPGPSGLNDPMSRRRRSPSQHRSMSRKDEPRSRGRPTVPAYHTNPPSADQRSPLPSSESPSFSIQPSRSSSMPGTQQSMMFGQWAMDFSPTSPATEGPLPALFQSFSRKDRAVASGSATNTTSGNGNDSNDGAGMAMDLDPSSFGSGPNAGAGMDPSTFLAMLGGEPLSNAPFLPTFDSYAPSPADSAGAPYSPPNGPHRSASTGFELGFEATANLPDSELAILAHFYDKNFSASGIEL
ncbi:hypothetical protein DXG03_008315 [Asterophora parasitica]|uniref:Xylanolytic transcriptional activator regulatory domain-containing protein n=1 Tax=Asterophora parasitica TaxID=117018 RepID=A0A9P7KBF8_9AGAR|nr:hypothetical protein DXG03_008315 [Asterophora parasitica]